MKTVTSNEPRTFQLFGFSSKVEDRCFGKVGLRLMNDVWRHVKETGLTTAGINHWVYPSDNSMFVGVELTNPAQDSSQLELVQFELRRYLEHVHIGPYEKLPSKWAALKAGLRQSGEATDSYALEIYGHHCDDESKLETTILIGLK